MEIIGVSLTTIIWCLIAWLSVFLTELPMVSAPMLTLGEFAIYRIGALVAATVITGVMWYFLSHELGGNRGGAVLVASSLGILFWQIVPVFLDWWWLPLGILGIVKIRQGNHVWWLVIGGCIWGLSLAWLA